jgi:mono/diheme cytochrome c family protein
VAAADPPFPLERLIVGIPLHARIERELVSTSPVPADGGTMMAGAQVYRDQCAVCHGFHGKSSSFGVRMYPDAPQLWEKHSDNDVVGVSDDPPGVTYWKVSNGIRLTGMPAFKRLLTDTQMWQVSILLAGADKPLPPAVLDILRGKGLATPVLAVTAAPSPKQPAIAAEKK